VIEFEFPETVAFTLNCPLGAGELVPLGIGVAEGVAPVTVTLNCAYEVSWKAPMVIAMMSSWNSEILR
jgi:hypothetical protein